MSATLERVQRAPTRTLPEVWADGQPIDWPIWVPIQRANGWPPFAHDVLRLACIPDERLTIHALLDAGRRGELHG